MRVLVACEYSGVVRDAFTRAGHDAYSCDLLPSETPGNHIEGDVLECLGGDWDLMIAHPPCTYLANSGVRWLYEDPDRWAWLDEATAFFNALLDAPIDSICVENPIPHKYAVERLDGSRYTQLIQPWQFGHMETKATCLWLKGLPKLVPTSDLKEETMALPESQRGRIFYASPSADRWKERSKTYEGIAAAMAAQWT